MINLLSGRRRAAVLGIVRLSRGVLQPTSRSSAWYVGSVPVFFGGTVVYLRDHCAAFLLVILIGFTPILIG
jgi:hypothetical protein